VYTGFLLSNDCSVKLFFPAIISGLFIFKRLSFLIRAVG